MHHNVHNYSVPIATDHFSAYNVLTEMVQNYKEKSLCKHCTGPISSQFSVTCCCHSFVSLVAWGSVRARSACLATIIHGHAKGEQQWVSVFRGMHNFE